MERRLSFDSILFFVKKRFVQSVWKWITRWTLLKTVISYRASAIKLRDFVALLEEVEGEYGEIIFHTNVKWL
jgi:hypothetical protein